MNKTILAVVSALSFSVCAQNTIINEQFTKQDYKSEAINVDAKSFIGKVVRIINSENHRLQSEREKLQKLKYKDIYSDDDKLFIDNLSKHYFIDKNLEASDKISKLLLMVDIVPISLIVSHMLVEIDMNAGSIENLNYFNKPCILKSCLLNKVDLSYESERYYSVYSSIDEYIYNINTNSVFSELREKRSLDRKLNRFIDSYEYISYLSVFGDDQFIDLVKMKMDNLNL